MDLSVSNVSNASTVSNIQTENKTPEKTEDAINPGVLEKTPANDVFGRNVSSVNFVSSFFGTALSGNTEGAKFNIQRNGNFQNFFRFANSYSGSINDKETSFDIKPTGLLSEKITGTVGDKEVELSVTKNIMGASIRGKFGDEEVDLKFKPSFFGYKVSGENTDYKISDGWFGNLKVSGEFGCDNELLPVILTYAGEVVQRDRNDAAMAAANM